MDAKKIQISLTQEGLREKMAKWMQKGGSLFEATAL